MKGVIGTMTSIAMLRDGAQSTLTPYVSICYY